MEVQKGYKKVDKGNQRRHKKNATEGCTKAGRAKETGGIRIIVSFIINFIT